MLAKPEYTNYKQLVFIIAIDKQLSLANQYIKNFINNYLNTHRLTLVRISCVSVPFREIIYGGITDKRRINMSVLPKFTMRELFDSGVHFGHKTMRWNPKMAPYIFGTSNNIHIIDLQKTVPLLYKAMEVARDVSKRNGRILFVSTKRQASPIVAHAAERCGQYYVNHRWLGGMLTNWGTISKSIKTLNQLHETLEDKEITLSKKERLQIERKVEKLEKALGGIKNMGGTPDLIVVIDTNKEHIAVKEANNLGIPVIAIVDTNCDPDNITHIIPGNDDAIKSIDKYCSLISDSILCGIQESVIASGADIGANANAGSGKPAAKIVDSKPATKAAEKKPAAKKAEAKPATKAAEKKPAAKKAEAKPATKAAEKKPAAKKATAKKDENQPAA